MKENHMNQIVDWIDSILMNADDEANTLRVKNEVNEFMKQFPLY
jgi:glycine hydroxymethyltransferase